MVCDDARNPLHLLLQSVFVHPRQSWVRTSNSDQSINQSIKQRPFKQNMSHKVVYNPLKTIPHVLQIVNIVCAVPFGQLNSYCGVTRDSFQFMKTMINLNILSLFHFLEPVRSLVISFAYLVLTGCRFKTRRGGRSFLFLHIKSIVTPLYCIFITFQSGVFFHVYVFAEI